MEFLKKEIFYPVNGLYNEDLINKTNSKYNDYLESLKTHLPKRLIKTYIAENRFHDYIVKNIVILGNAKCYGTKSDKIKLVLVFEKVEIIIDFDNITFFKIENSDDNSCWVSILPNNKLKETLKSMEEIVLCELGMTEEMLYRFEYLSSSGSVFEIHFSKVNITKRIKRY